MKAALRVVCFVAAFFSVIFGLGQLDRSHEDDELRLALLPANVYLKNAQIGQTFGYYASEYWRVVVYERDPARWEAMSKIHRSFGTQVEVDRQVKAAIAANFVVVHDAKRDAAIQEAHAQLVARAPDLHRRRVFSQRVKDCLAWIGAASICGLVGWIILKQERQEMRLLMPHQNDAT